MLGHLTVELRDNKSKQGMSESEFKLVVIYLMEREYNEKITNEGKDTYRQSRLTRKMSDDCYTI